MSRRNTPRRSPDHSHQLSSRERSNRRFFIITALTAATGLGAVALIDRRPRPEQLTDDSHPPSPDPIKGLDTYGVVDFNAIVDYLTQHGEIVFDETHGQPEHLEIVFKQFHGSHQSFTTMLQDYRLFTLHEQHHAGITRAIKDIVTHYDGAKCTVAIEGPGYVGDISTWDADINGTLDFLNKSDRYEADKSAFRELVRQGTVHPNSAGYIETFFSSTTLVAAHCRQHGIAAVGTDIPGQIAMSGRVHAIIRDFVAAYERPTDEQIQKLLERVQALENADDQQRHRHIAAIPKHPVPGSVKMTIIGHDHSNVGAKLGKIHSDGLEDYLIKKPNTRVVVLDQSDLEGYINRWLKPRGSEVRKKVDFFDISPSELRNYLDSLR